jgi:hypothetical protein
MVRLRKGLCEAIEDERLERLLRKRLREVALRNRSKLEKMRKEVWAWFKDGEEFEIVNLKVLVPGGAFDGIFEEERVVSREEMEEILEQLFSVLEDGYINYPKGMSKDEGWVLEDELEFRGVDIESEEDVERFIDEVICGFDYSIKGERLVVTEDVPGEEVGDVWTEKVEIIKR